MQVSEKIISQIIESSKKYDIEKVLLFGSRSRGDNRERSDIDLAVSGGNVNLFSVEIEDEIDTLLSFDVVDLGIGISEDLKNEIERDGIVLYEKI